MSKKSSQRSARILLDTSFLLPILGFETSERIMRAFEKLSSYELYYNDISVLEALWKIVKIIKGEESEIARIMEGIHALRNTMRYAPISAEAVENATRMYMLGHRDMIDNLLYSVALTSNLKLLTVDKELAEFIEEHGLPRENIALPEDLE